MTRFFGLALAAFCLTAAPVWSQPAEDENDEAARDLVEYVEVNVSDLPSSNTITTKLPVPLQMTPASVGAVPASLFAEQDGRLLGDALLNVSGLNVQSGGGVSDFFAIRGFDSVSSGLVMTDGAEEPEVSYYHLYNVQGVEVFKGPAGFLYGKNPLSGAVNMARKQPLPTNFTTVEATAASFGTAQATVDWNATRDGSDQSFRLNGLWRESDGYRDRTDSEHRAINPALTWRIGQDTSLNFNYEYVDARYGPDSGIPLYDPGTGLQLAEVDRRTSYQPETDFSDQKLNRFQIDFETRLSERVTLRNKTYYRDLDWESAGTLLFDTVPVAPYPVIRNPTLLDDRQQFVGNQLEAIFKLGSGSVQHRLLAGIELIRETDEYSFAVLPAESVLLFDPGTILPSPPGFTLNATGDVRNRVIAPYLIDQMQLFEEFEILVGLRYDDIDVEGEVTSLFTVDTSYKRDDSELSPMAGFVWAPSTSLSLYAHAAESYAPPSTRLVDEIDPESRNPERGTQFELGVKKQFLGGRLRSTLSIYELERENIALTGANGFTQQSGDQRSRGAELELAAEPLPGLRTFFSYAYNDAELTSFTPCVIGLAGPPCTPMNYTGNTPIMAPDHLANLWISKSFGNGWGLGGGARFIGEQFVSEDNRYKMDSAVVLNAFGHYDLKNWRFRLNLKNLSDTEYELRGIAGGSAVVPANPFSVHATVELRM